MAFVIKEIPINADDGNQEFEISLNSTSFRVALSYNSRLDLWALDIRTPQGVDIITGILLVAGVDLLAQYSLKEKHLSYIFLQTISVNTA